MTSNDSNNRAVNQSVKVWSRPKAAEGNGDAARTTDVRVVGDYLNYLITEANKTKPCRATLRAWRGVG